MQVSVPDPGGPRAKGALGVKRYRSRVGSMLVMVKVTPAQAVPARPVPTGSSWKTPGSSPPVQLGSGGVAGGMPQEGIRVMSLPAGGVVPNWASRFASSPVALFRMVRLAGTSVSPTVTSWGNSGVTPNPTPAHAGPAPTTAINDHARRTARISRNRSDPAGEPFTA